MAARLQMLQSKATEASKLLAKKSCSLYKQTMEANKKYVVDPPTFEKCQELSKQLFYTRLARRGVEDHEIPLTSRSTIHNIDFQSSIFPAHYDSSCCYPCFLVWKLCFLGASCMHHTRQRNACFVVLIRQFLLSQDLL